jgi:hypothetical protein
MGPNHVLDKGFRTTGATAYTFGEIVTISTDGTTIARDTSAGSLGAKAIVQESIDAEKVVTGKAIINCRVLGISRVIAGAAVPLGSRVTNDVNARAVAVTRAAAGAQPAPVFGQALTAAANPGDQIDVLLTPGATY